ncbi:MAG: hypothetical protein U1A73_14250, partial [Pseudomonas sp.]|nr:hypothetical protein [Pseudomonas sp.]
GRPRGLRHTRCRCARGAAARLVTWASGSDPKGLGGKSNPEPDRGTDIKTGMKVFHNKFGEGKVLALEGAGAEARAQVSFTRHGVKWLALSVAKLTPVDD